MALRQIKQGIEAIQKGSYEEGARLLRIGLKKTDVPPHVRSVALMWLAQTQADLDFKIGCYQRARQADPENPDVINGLKALLEQQQREQPNRAVNNLLQNTQDEDLLDPIFRTAPPQPSDTSGFQVNPDFANDTGQIRAQKASHQNNPTEANPAGQRGYDPNTYGQGGGNNTPQQNYDFWQQPDTHGNPPQQQNTGRGNTFPHGNNNIPRFREDPSQDSGNFDTGQLRAHHAFDQQQRQHNQQPRTVQLQGIQRNVTVLGGPNGRGVGFFLTYDGLLATTRLAVGGESHVRVDLADGTALTGTVVRSFPEFDLALLKTEARLNQLYNITQMPTLADGTPIFVVTHEGQFVQTQKRGTRHQTQPHWFPTLINQLPGAGGNPIVDNQNVLVGMLTCNARRSTRYFYGLHISKIYQCAEQYAQETKMHTGDSAYCYSCGIMSRAPAFGGYYCENCGEVLSYAESMRRIPQPNLVSLYRENTQRPCERCQSSVGYYRGKCLRCGYEV